MADYTAQIEAIYLAYYGRPADVTGLAYWNTALNTANGDLASIINSFGTSAEATSLYSSSSNIAKINAIYVALFNRTADAEGLIYYAGLLDNGTKSQASIALDILNGATGDDLTLITKKLVVSADFTAAMQSDATAMIAYAGTTAATTARSMLSAVTADSDDSGVVETTLTTIETDTTDTTTAAAQTFTLTTGADDINTVTATLNDGATELTFVAGDGDDTFRATAGTLEDDDLLDGGEGSDTLDVYLNAAVAPIITNIETINIISRNAAASLDLTDISGVDAITATGNNDLAIIEIDAEAAPTISIADYSDDLTLTLADDTGEADTLTLGVDGMTGTIDVTNAVEIIALTASGEASEFTLDDAESALETVTVSGAGDVNVTFTTTDTSFVEFDASDATGDVTLTVSTTSALAATGGAGDDTFEFGTTLTASDTVVGGAGEDTLTFTIASTGSIRPTVSTVEIVDATFTAAGTLNLLNGATVTTVEVGGSSANMAISNASVKFTEVTVADDADFDLDVDYASGVVGDLTITIGDSSEGEGASVNVDAVSTDATSLTIASIGDDANSTDTLTAASATSLTFTTDSADSDLTVGTIDADAATSITITATEGDITVGAYADADTLTTLVMTATGEGSITVGDIGAAVASADASALTEIKATLEAGALIIGDIQLTNAAEDNTAALSSVDITTAGSVTLGDIVVTGEGSASLDSYTMTVTGDDAVIATEDVVVTNLDEITLTLSGADGTAGFDSFDAEEDIGDVTIVVGEDTDLTITLLNSGESIGNIDITAGQDATVAITNITAGTDIGDITLSSTDNATFSFILTGESVGTIDASDTDSDSNVTIDAALITSTVTLVLGDGTNIYTASALGDDITLADGAGTDTINLIANDTSVTIENFEAGTGGDVIAFDISQDFSALQDGNSAAITAASVQNIVEIANATTTLLAGDNIIVLTGATFGTVALAEAAIEDAGTRELTLTAANTANDDFIIVWSDGTDSYVGSYNATSAATNPLTGGLTIITTLTGVVASTAGTLVDANFDFVL